MQVTTTASPRSLASGSSNSSFVNIFHLQRYGVRKRQLALSALASNHLNLVSLTTKRQLPLPHSMFLSRSRPDYVKSAVTRIPNGSWFFSAVSNAAEIADMSSSLWRNS